MLIARLNSVLLCQKDIFRVLDRVESRRLQAITIRESTVESAAVANYGVKSTDDSRKLLKFRSSQDRASGP